MRLIFLTALLTISLLASAQRGTLRGSVYDAETGESLVGVSVLLKGTLRGTITDLDGKFSMEVDPGTYDVQVSYISYQPLTIEKVIIKSNEVKLLNNLKLQESTFELEGVVITAEVVRTSEAAINTVKRKSAVIMDGISSSRMQLIGDGNAVEAAKRVTGVSVEGGKYVYVRGLGDRYSKTTLNQMDIPGLDPDRNSLQMDIFPTNLVDNIIVSKNFTADLPADFTGGMLNIETKDFPEEKSLSVSIGLSYNPAMHFNPDFLTYEGGKTDFLGFDDGMRALPARAARGNIPTPVSGATSQEVSDFVQSFSPYLGAQRQTSFVNYSAGLSFGNQINVGRKKENGQQAKLGYIFALSYKNEQTFYDEVTYSEYQRYIDPDAYELRYATIQTGQVGEQNVLVGAIGGLAYKTMDTKIRLTALHLQNGESRAGKFFVENDGAAVGQSGYFAGMDNLEYNQRGLTNVLLNGTHLRQATGWEFDWRVSPTFSTSEDPDIRKTAFTYSNQDTSFSAGAGGNPARIWRSLSELNLSSKADATKKYRFNKHDAKLKFGVSHNFKNRDYEILFFDIQFFGSQSWTNPDPSTVLDPINIYPNKPNSIYYQSGNNNPNPNEYQSNVNNLAFYVSNEFQVTPNLKSILGLRVENYVQRHTGRDQTFASGDMTNGKNLDNEKVLESTDLFPSVNFIYALTEKQNLRASYSRTIARPSFKELSFAQILDPITNRIFNGSLFTYTDWDGSLTETRINNIDLRWELFLERGQIFSVSGFYKQFDDPIELVRIPEAQTSTEYQTRNVGDGHLFGLELEIRKDLDFISPKLKHFNLNGNLTLVESVIEMTQVEFNARKNYEKTGESIEDTRAMAGQSPYVINAGLIYSHYEMGLDAGIFYNVKGSTLTIVGVGLYPDVYIEPFHSLNVSFNKKFGEDQKTQLDFKISNLLDDKVESVYRSYEAQDALFSSLNPGRTFSIGISHKF